MQRRHFVLSTTVSACAMTTGGILLPQRATADPLIAAAVIAILPSMISAIHSLFTANKDRAESNALEREKIAAQERMAHANLVDGRVRYMMTRTDERNKAQMDMVLQWLGMGVTNKEITYLAATDAYRKTLATLGLSENIDGKGTYLGVKDGALYAGRSGFGGTEHAGEVEISKALLSVNGTLPVPVRNAQEIDISERTSAIDSIAKSLKMDGSTFEKEYALMSKRGFSSARNPTAAMPDENIYAVVNKAAYERGQRVVPYEFMLG